MGKSLARREAAQKERATYRRGEVLVAKVHARIITQNEIQELVRIKRRQRKIRASQAALARRRLPTKKVRVARGRQGLAGGITSVVSGGLPGLGKRR
jgi:hypothetical protein